MDNNDRKQFEEKVIQVKRVSKKNSGGNRISFTALVVVGDREGKIGFSLGKAPNVVEAIQKAVSKAKATAINVNIVNGTLPYDTNVKMGSAKIYAKPAPEGAGIIAGGAVRQVFELAGVKNVSAKIIGTRNKNLNVRAAYKLLNELRTVEPKKAKKSSKKVETTQKKKTTKAKAVKKTKAKTKKSSSK
jgi:small subunit ribosomal protein S5